jgi:hypothetical protein
LTVPAIGTQAIYFAQVRSVKRVLAIGIESKAELWPCRRLTEKVREHEAMQSAASSGEGGMAAYIDARSELPGAPVASGRLIARIWSGQTLAVRADDYAKYLYDEGVCAIARTPGNRGVQMLRKVDGDIADFQVLSFWESVESIKRFGGDKYERGSSPTRRSTIHNRGGADC